MLHAFEGGRREKKKAFIQLLMRGTGACLTTIENQFRRPGEYLKRNHVIWVLQTQV